MRFPNIQPTEKAPDHLKLELSEKIKELQEMLAKNKFSSEKERKATLLSLLDLLEKQEEAEGGEIITMDDALHYTTNRTKNIPEDTPEKESVS